MITYVGLRCGCCTSDLAPL